MPMMYLPEMPFTNRRRRLYIIGIDLHHMAYRVDGKPHLFAANIHHNGPGGLRLPVNVYAELLLRSITGTTFPLRSKTPMI